MTFCGDCGSILKKNTTANSAIDFICGRCAKKYPGTAEDTLMYEEYLATGESMLRHEVFIENSAFDQARNIVNRDCAGCRRDYMTVIMVGENENVMYTCVCGRKEDNSGREITNKS